MRVKLSVYCGADPFKNGPYGCGNLIGTYYDEIHEKWPFWCENCQSRGAEDKYPWKIVAEIVEE